MFSTDVVDSDSFLDMPVSARCLYYDLGMRADDDGFVNPRKVVRLTSASEDDLKVLAGKKFIIPFNSGVIVIKDWKMNNYIQSDRYVPTIYHEEKKQLLEDPNRSYFLASKNTNSTKSIQNVYKMDTQVRLGKVRLGKVREERDEEITPDKPESSLSWLGTLDNQEKFHCGIPEETLQALSKKYKASVDQIKNKAEDLFMWCKTKREVKKNYKMFLQVVLKRDFGSRTEHDIELQERIDRTKESIAAGSSPFAKSLAAKMKM